MLEYAYERNVGKGVELKAHVDFTRGTSGRNAVTGTMVDCFSVLDCLCILDVTGFQ
jgi:hypothetical protein